MLVKKFGFLIMCGRFALSATTKDIEKLIPNIEFDGSICQSQNITPSQLISIITNSDKMILSSAIWGLLPSWSKDKKVSAKMFNARAETINEKVSFKNQFKNKRCLIPASSFYEWNKLSPNNKKQAYRISAQNQKLIFFGGIWDVWKDENDEYVKSATIITTQANDQISKIHDRMPLILDNFSMGKWLNDDEDIGELNKMLCPYQKDQLQIEELEPNFFNKRSQADTSQLTFF